MSAAGAILLEVDPNIVRPGWLPGIILLALLGATVLLYFSLRKQLRRIDVPDDHRDEAGGSESVESAESSTPGPTSPRSG